MAAIRLRNAKAPFEIHHDEMDPDESLEEEHEEMGESRAEEEGDDDAQHSDFSDESDMVIDPSVLEDMEKFQDTFKGIKERFRLINRIGEGISRVTKPFCIY
jgi:cell division control protein 7